MIECGAASLSMILRQHGKFLPLSAIRKQCGVSRDGTNLLKIKEAAAHYDLDVYPFKASLKEALDDEDNLPFIGWWNHNHFLVIEGQKNGKVCIADPAGGKYRLSMEQAESCFSGIGLTFEPTESFKPEGKPERHLLTFLDSLQPYAGVLKLVLVIGLCAILPAILIPGLSGAFLKYFLEDRRYDLGLPLVWLSLGTAALGIGLDAVKLAVTRKLALRIDRRLSLQIAKKLMTVDYRFFSSRYIGDIASRINLSTTITSTLIHTLIPYTVSILTAFAIIPIVMLISWQLSLASAIYAALSCSLAYNIANTIRDGQMSLKIDQGKLSGINVRMLADARTIKASGLEHNYLVRWQQLFSPLTAKSQAIQSKMGRYQWIDTLVNSVYEYGTIALSGYLVINGSLNLAGFIAFQALRMQILGPVLSVSSITTELQEARADVGRLTDLAQADDDENVRSLNAISSIPVAKTQQKTDQQRANIDNTAEIQAKTQSYIPIDRDFAGGLDCIETSFAFSEQLPDVVSGVDLSLKPGCMLTIVGPSGGGKSTLMKLLAGLYKPTEGKILYGGNEWLRYSSEDMGNAIGYVSQDYSAIRGTILENISLLDPDISDDDLKWAIPVACLNEAIDDTVHGLNTVLGSGGIGLSGGQLQRLAIARALIKRPKYLFLDEATSALDVLTEKKLLRQIRREGITTVCVAHRLISAKMSDQVIYLEAGRVVEAGSPQELIRDERSRFSRLIEEERRQT